MANERNKILPYALSAIEGVNIQSQEDYSASSETTDGVSTGLANGNNFNKLAKQVSIMSSSLAEFIVNTLAEQTISDTNSIEEISSALNSAILKLIKDNEPVIPDKAGITVIDDNSTDITSFNQITEDGIYYIYKQLSDGPSQNGEAIKYGFIYLIVINASVTAQNLDICMQMTSFGPTPSYPMPGNIGSAPMVRVYNKTSKQWEDWDHTFGIPFINNNIVISDFTIDKLDTKFPIIATDNTFPNSYNTFMYSATKAQMRAQLGIADSPDLTDYFNKTTDKLDLATQVKGQLKNANIADNAITTSKIASLAITADKLASSSVTNAKIANGAVTDAKFSGTLSVAKGGTNTEDGYLFANVMTFSELRKRFTALGSGAVTTEQFINAITPTKKTGFNVDMVSAKSFISDFPLDNAVLEVVRLTNNTVILTARDLFVLTTYEFRKSPEGLLTGWRKTRNDDGSIPADLIPPTVLTYTNDQGTWTETKLSDGTTMLEGWGYKICDNKQQADGVYYYVAVISTPKRLNTFNYMNSNADISFIPSNNIQLLEYKANYNNNVNKISIIRYYKDNLGTILPSKININWYIKGILA